MANLFERVEHFFGFHDDGKINPDFADFFEQPTEESVNKNFAANVDDMTLMQWDAGIFSNELRKLDLTPEAMKADPKRRPITKGTYSGTQLALTEGFARIEKSYGTYFQARKLEQRIPMPMNLDEKKKIFVWQTDNYPPHVQTVPSDQSVPEYKLFNVLGLVETALLLPKLVPDSFFGWAMEEIRGWVLGDPEKGATMAKLEKLNRENRKSGTDIMKGANIGDTPDWYTDARFAQQAFTGNNPTTIRSAAKPRAEGKKSWVDEFTAEAKRQKSKIAERLTGPNPNPFYVQDASFFREAVGAKPGDALVDGEGDDKHWLCASVTLYELHKDGKLHPVAVLIDWKGSMEDSVTIFNENRPTPSSDLHTEPTDWPWRYAKTCSQVSDWIRHEVGAHLVNTHFIEEVTIVATNRCFGEDHPVFRMLSPHWLKTLSLNAAARDTLVPKIIFDLAGLTEQQNYNYINYTFDNFNFVENYVPKELTNRGFLWDDIHSSDKSKSEKYKNYAYAKNVASLWCAIRNFIEKLVNLEYSGDPAVQEDGCIKNWCEEIQTSGRIPTFPSIKSRAELIDAVTMCIHLAAVQHTAVNYLQNFYQAFVVNKPPALFAAPPKSLEALRKYKEQDLMKALPTGIDRQRYWLLSAQIPWLLSFRAPAENTLLTYAVSGYKLYKYKETDKEKQVRDAFACLFDELKVLASQFLKTSKNINSGSLKEIPYMVVDPSNAAVSILI